MDSASFMGQSCRELAAPEDHAAGKQGDAAEHAGRFRHSRQRTRLDRGTCDVLIGYGQDLEIALVESQVTSSPPWWPFALLKP